MKTDLFHMCDQTRSYSLYMSRRLSGPKRNSCEQPRRLEWLLDLANLQLDIIAKTKLSP